MLTLDLTEEQRLLEQSVREWAAREVAPRIRDLDREHRFDPQLLPQMASLGLLGVCNPEQYGGAGMDYLCLGLASEELEYVDTSLRVILWVHTGLNSSVRYAKERTAFGVEIGSQQLVKAMIAQMESDYQASRLLWMRVGWLKNAGRRNTRETGLAKWFATVASERAASDAVQVHGANGYSDEYPVGRFYRNCKGAVIYEGTREIHTIMQADYLLGYRSDRPIRCELPAWETP